jgi:hypothetical protein
MPPAAYKEWSGSMHAYAADDPVFRAMNQRAQRETSNALGTFCVKCHAPMAVQEGLTTTGLDLDTLPQKMKGVTCYFCHATEAVEDTHNNPLKLATDDSLFGPFSDPVAGTPHKGIYSRFLDGATMESASMCGSCHDIQNMQGAHVERTFEEWQGTLFSKKPTGQGCASCHMNRRAARRRPCRPTRCGPCTGTASPASTSPSRRFPRWRRSARRRRRCSTR